MDIVGNLISNGTEITFSTLFIALFLWNIRTNDEREKRYQDTINTLTTALNGYEDIKEDVQYIRHKIG